MKNQTFTNGYSFEIYSANESEIDSCQWNGKLEIISHCWNEKIRIINCHSDGDIYIKGEFSSVQIIDSTIHGDVNIFTSQDNTNEISTNNSTIRKLEIKVVKLNTLKIFDSELKAINIKDASISEIKISNSECCHIRIPLGIEKNPLKNFHIINSRCNTVILPSVHLKNVNITDSEINAITYVSPKIIKELKTFKFFSLLKKEYDLLSLGRFIEIMRLLHTSFESKKSFYESDIALFALKNLEIAYKIKRPNTGLLAKIRHYLTYFSLGGIFGWGIKIGRSIMAMVLVILGFGIGFGHLYTGHFLSLEGIYISIERFFLLSSTSSDQYDYYFPWLEYSESILGIMFIAFFTAVAIRKIIR